MRDLGLKLKATVLVSLLLLSLAFVPVAHAAPPTPTVCTLSSSSVNFGAYDVFSANPNDSTGTLTVNCDKTTSVTVSIGISPNSGGFNPRKMKLDPFYLNYNLYTDSARTQIWGDGTGSTFTLTRSCVKNKPESISVYGRITPIQDIGAGIYNDTLTVTIVW